MKLKINNVPGYSGIVSVEVDELGTPKSRFWRRRLKDSEVDNCVEIVKPTKTKKKEPKT